MALYVNSNAASLNAQRNLYNTGLSLNKSLQRLSSGLRINSAKDDAAGLAIANGMTAKIRGLNQAARNANDGISLAQTAEGALDETTNLLQRMRELSVQSASGTYENTDRDKMDAEYQELVSELDRIQAQTTFNGKILLDSTLDVDVQVGSEAGEIATLAIGQDMSAAGLAVNLDVTSSDNASAAITAIDTALGNVAETRATLGAFQNRMESTVKNLMNVSENLAASRSRIQDADFAAETADMTRAQILQQSGVAILAQAKQMPQTALSLLGG